MMETIPIWGWMVMTLGITAAGFVVVRWHKRLCELERQEWNESGGWDDY